MGLSKKTIIGTSGYSFPDWVGTFYPEGTPSNRMLDYYVQHFPVVELNFTYYGLPKISTIEGLTNRTPDNFSFWVKANQETTHKQNRSVAAEFIAALAPMKQSGKLAGIVLQFPQSFRRTVANRQYLAHALDDLAGTQLAVEFRHESWADVAVEEGLRQRDVALVIPDAPPIPGLYRVCPRVTARVGYFRLHSRNAENWYAGIADRYDYSYSNDELRDVAGQWAQVEASLDRLYVFFNNCHRGQAAQNAESFKKVLETVEK